MARMKPELRKQELLEIAFRQFLQQGYEKTSIRSIVGEADGEIGMFYHHFSSKEEIFTEVLEQYNAGYVEELRQIINKESRVSFGELMERILSHLEGSLAEYRSMNSGSANKEVLALLHQKTLISLKPIFCGILHEYAGRGEISPPETDVGLLTDFMLSGISAVLHNDSEKSMSEKRGTIRKLIIKLLEKAPEP